MSNKHSRLEAFEEAIDNSFPIITVAVLLIVGGLLWFGVVEIGEWAHAFMLKVAP